MTGPTPTPGPTADRPGTARPGLAVGPVSTVLRPRAALVTVVLVVLTLVLAVDTLARGTVDLPASRVVAVLTGQGNGIEQLVVERRLGRVAAAVLVGFLLGVSGALTQTITRNPIASPDILGVTAGAGVVAVAIVVNPLVALEATGQDAAAVLVPGAIVGAAATTAVVLALAWRGGFDGMRLVLVGLGVNAVALAATSWLLLTASIESAAVATRWLAGSIDGVRLDDAALLLPVLAVVAVGTLRLGPSLAALRLGRDVASSLGVRAGRVELAALGLAVAAAGATTAVAGPVPFVAFVAPQVALRLLGTAGPPPLAAGVAGALMVLAADRVASTLPTPLPVGVLTAAIGAPVLMYLLTRRTRSASV